MHNLKRLCIARPLSARVATVQKNRDQASRSMKKTPEALGELRCFVLQESEIFCDCEIILPYLSLIYHDTG
jgi:hypothetical protein